jgi:hypothetical protein
MGLRRRRPSPSLRPLRRHLPLRRAAAARRRRAGRYSALPGNEDLALGTLPRGGRGGGPRTKELYDAFGEQGEDDDDDEPDENTALRAASPSRGAAVGFHEGFLDDDDANTPQTAPDPLRTVTSRRRWSRRRVGALLALVVVGAGAVMGAGSMLQRRGSTRRLFFSTAWASNIIIYGVIPTSDLKMLYHGLGADLKTSTDNCTTVMRCSLFVITASAASDPKDLEDTTFVPVV